MVETIFQYRTLVGKCELGCGLEWEEIDQLAIIEQLFAPERAGRRSRRRKVQLSGLLRGDRINDRVEILELGPGGLACRNAPFIARGELVEIVIDDADRSYRFSAEGVWLKDDGDDYRVGLRFVGMPVCLHRVQVSVHQVDVVDRIANAA